MAISTPCIGICSVDEDAGLCVGCFRSLQEITDWRRLKEEERLRIMQQELPERREKFSALLVRYGGQ